jgi:citrate lyase subunit beta/citryl-CoA lyase
MLDLAIIEPITARLGPQITSYDSSATSSRGWATDRANIEVSGDDGLFWARSHVVVAVRAAGLPRRPGQVPNVSDLDGVTNWSVAGRRLGFLGRNAIRPRQLPAIVEAFRPAADVARASEVLAAMAEAETHESGTVVLPDGRFADRAMVVAARPTTELAER